MIIIRVIYKFIRLMEANTTTTQLTCSIVFGMFMGFSSPLTLQWWVTACAIFLFNLNFPLFLGSWAIFATSSLFLTSLFHRLGNYLLHSQQLLPFWTEFYHLPIIPFTRFYKSTILGELVVSLLFCVPLYTLSKYLIDWARPIVYHTWRMTKLYRLYVFYKPYTR